MLRKIVVVLAAMLFSSCSSAEQVTEPGGRAQGVDLPSPSLALRQTSAQTGLRELSGPQYADSAAHNRVTVNGDSLEFAAAGGTDLESTAFAVFELDLADYEGSSELGMEWAAALPDAALWVGLANFEKDRWDWQAGSDELLQLAGHSSYVSPEETVLVALVFLATAPGFLERIWFGDFAVEAPSAVTATASQTIPPQIELSWQPPVNGPAPDSYAVWRSDSPSGPFIRIAQVPGTSCVDTDVQTSTDYWYRLTGQLSGAGHSRYATAHCSVGAIWHTDTVFGPFTDTTIFDPHTDICITENQGHPLVAVAATATDGTYNSVLHVFEAADEFGASWLPRRDTVGHACYPAPQRLTLIGGSLHWLMSGLAGVPGEYRVAQDSALTQWSAPVEHTTQGSNAQMWYLADAGTPLAYSAQAHLDWQIMYQQAPDVQGSSWGVGVSIKHGIKGVKESLSNLVLVGGVPTIFFAHSDNGDLSDGKVMMIRQLNGDVWAATEAFDIDPNPAYHVTHTWAMVIEGEPALFYHHKTLNGGEVNELRFTRRSGNTWSSPLTLAELGSGVFGWQRPMSAAIIDGRPAVACQAAESESGQWGVIYCEAADSLGTAWDDPVLIFEEGGLGLVTLSAVGSPQRPVIAWARDEYSVGFASRY
jgi:hypothetical protein